MRTFQTDTCMRNSSAHVLFDLCQKVLTCRPRVLLSEFANCKMLLTPSFCRSTHACLEHGCVDVFQVRQSCRGARHTTERRTEAAYCNWYGAFYSLAQHVQNELSVSMSVCPVRHVGFARALLGIMRMTAACMNRVLRPHMICFRSSIFS